MVFRIYNILMRLGTPALWAYLDLRRKRGKEDARRMAERKGVPGLERPSGFMVWAHAASIGESLSLLPVISKLLENYPKLEILVTTGTVTSAKLMAQRLPPRAFHQYVPVDHPAWVERFLDHWHPDLALWIESDFWPNLLAGLHRRGIPAILLNARMSARSFARWSKMTSAARTLLQSFTTCFAQNDAEAQRLAALGARDVRVCGNLKYAAMSLPVADAERRNFKAMIGTRPALLWASTHAGEEEIAIRLHEKLAQETDPKFLTVIAPRHPARAADIAKIMTAQNIRFSRRSLGETISDDTQVYLADTIGELGLFFAEIPFVAMGGSFGNTGGHNPIEAAQFGNTIFFGPSRHNFLTIADEFTAAHAMINTGSEQELADALISAYKNPDAARKTGDAARQLVREHARVLDDVMRELHPFIRDKSA